MRAPKPTLICAGTRDVTFDIGGTWNLFRQSKRFYARLGYPERVDLNEADIPHGMYLQQREASARWMYRWLLGSEKVIHEVDPKTLPDPASDQELRALSEGDWTQEELYCTSEGQALLLPNEQSVFQINARIERELRQQRRAAWEKLDDHQRRELGRKTIGPMIPNVPERAPTPPKHEVVGVIQRDGYAIEKLVLSGAESELALPGLLFVPEKVNKSPILYLHGESMKTDAHPGGPIERLVQQGHSVLAAELSGIGETETGHHKRDYGRGRFGRDVQEIHLAYLIGRSYVGMRTDDVLRWSEFLSSYQRTEKRPIQLIAVGEAAIPTLHAAALEPSRFASVRLKRMIGSWAEVVAAPASLNQLVNTVHGVLRHYDLPELVGLAGRDSVIVEESVDVLGKVIK